MIRKKPGSILRTYAPLVVFYLVCLSAYFFVDVFQVTRSLMANYNASSALVAHAVLPHDNTTTILDANTSLANTEPKPATGKGIGANGGALNVENPTLVSPNMTKVWFVSNKKTFEIPTDVDWIMKYAGCRTGRPHDVAYMRGTDEIRTRGRKGKCAGALDVFGWLMERVNENNGVLILAYGGLIHAHREKDFVNKAGKFIDDDIDTLTSLDTFSYIASLEKELFNDFGWSVRIHHINGKFATLAQIFASCGHTITLKQSKAKSSLPTIEVYPIVTIKSSEPTIEVFPKSKVDNPERKEHSIVRDIWQGSLFRESMIFPLSNMTLMSAGARKPLNLQIPGQYSEVLDCLYGNWRSPSAQRAGTRNCL